MFRPRQLFLNNDKKNELNQKPDGASKKDQWGELEKFLASNKEETEKI